MKHLLRRHPIAVGIPLMILSPYILGAVVLVVAVWVLAYVVAVALDAAAGRR